jgi:hypothetical protein
VIDWLNFSTSQLLSTSDDNRNPDYDVPVSYDSLKITNSELGLVNPGFQNLHVGFSYSGFEYIRGGSKSILVIRKLLVFELIPS